MEGAEAGERCQKAVLTHSPMASARIEGLEGPQEAGGEAGETPARRCDTAPGRKAGVRKKNIFLRLEQTKFTGVDSFEVCSVILAQSSSLMALFPSPIGKACVWSHL